MARAAAAAASPRILSSLFAHVRSLPVSPSRWCHSNMFGDSELLAEALEEPGVDFKHWFVGINFGTSLFEENRNASIEERIDFYIKTLAKVVGSEEEAKKKIYKVNCTEDYRRRGCRAGIGCEIDWETSNLLKGLHHVSYVTPDFYADPENTDYGGEYSFINGKLFERSTKRMLQVEPISSILEKPWTELLSSRQTPTPSPWLLLPPPAFGDHKDMYNKVYRIYSIAELKEFSINRNEEEEEEDEIVGSSHGWLALFRRCSRQLFLSNPLSGQHIKLPSIHDTFGQVGKVIISCSPNSEEEQCRAVMIFGPKNHLAYCSPGHNAARWTLIGDNSCCNYSDIVYSHSQKLFLCLTNSGGLEGWDLQDPVCPKMVEEQRFDVIANYPMEEVGSLEKHRIHQVKHLVLDEQSEELFIVMRQIWRHQSGWGYYVQSPDAIYPYKTLDIKMYKIDKERKACLSCRKRLNGLAMFVGTNHSFALQASQFREFDADSILFTDEKRVIPPGWASLPYGSPDIDVYNYKQKFFYSGDHGKGWHSALGGYKYPYVCDARVMRRAPPLPIWFTPTLR